MNNDIDHSLRAAAVSRANERGMTLIELGIVMLIISLIVVGIYSKATSINDEAKIQRAIDDSVLLLTKAALYRSENGDYADLSSIGTLNDSGYSTDPIDTGTSQNPWGKNYSLSVDESDDGLVQLTVATDSEEICTRLKSVMDGLVNNQDSVECGSNKTDLEIKAR